MSILPDGFELPLATTLHAHHLAPFLKEADKQEIQAASGHPPLTALLESLVLSEESYAILKRGEVIGLFGLASKEGIGIPWFLSSSAIKSDPKFITMLALKALSAFHKSYPLLMNFCDARNTKTLKWLAWCGFKFTALIPDYGVEKRPFYQFIRKREDLGV